jgi:methionyl-tRNA synthetase
VFGHGFLTLNGQRMSKSLGTIVDPIEAADRHGKDPLRLYLVKEIAFGGDGDFSWDRFDERYNVDLANNLGNLVSRVSTMVHRYRQGRLSPTTGPTRNLSQSAEWMVKEYRTAMDAFAIHEGAAAAFRLLDVTNEFIAGTEPWRMAKDPARSDELTQTLFDASEAIRIATVLLVPIMPASSAEILRRIGVASSSLNLDRDGRWRNDGERVFTQDGSLWPRHESRPEALFGPASKEMIVENQLRPGTPEVKSGSALEPKDPGTLEAQPPSTLEAKPPSTLEAKQPISIDDFMKVELRVAKILGAERVPKSNRLLKLLVDVGTEQRTIVAGIAEAYEPETLVGRTVVIVFNLKPAKLMGVESNGMVLAASPDGGKPALLGFEEAPAPGTRVR